MTLPTLVHDINKRREDKLVAEKLWPVYSNIDVKGLPVM